MARDGPGGSCRRAEPLETSPSVHFLASPPGSSETFGGGVEAGRIACRSRTIWRCSTVLDRKGGGGVVGQVQDRSSGMRPKERTHRGSWRGKMEIAKKTYMFVAALFVFLLVGPPTDVEAQGGGLTCGWCIELFIQARGVDIHGFPWGGDECGWPNRGPAYRCSRCGGSSHCHSLFSEHSLGRCHIRCGGTPPPEDEEVLAHVVSDLRSGLDAMDLEAVAATIAFPRNGFAVEYLPEAGRIDLVLACDPSVPAATVPVPPVIRPDLDRALRDPVAAFAGRGRDGW